MDGGFSLALGTVKSPWRFLQCFAVQKRHIGLLDHREAGIRSKFVFCLFVFPVTKTLEQRVKNEK